MKDLAVSSTSRVVLRGSPGVKKTATETETGQFIFDPSTQTTYIKGKLLGKGGFARCYELTNRRTGKVYAAKIVPKCRIAKAHQREKMVREIELHRDLSHKNVVAFHGFFEDSENVYIVLENCSKKSLVHVLRYRKTVTEAECRYYVRQLVEACKYLHAQHIIHRDLKLGNMLLNDQMQMKVADFGLAAKVEYEGERKMTVCGTPNYIAPEVLGKKGHSYPADVWATGCIIYALLVGRPPFETSSLKETYMRIANNQYNIPTHVSSPARNLIRRCLSASPEARPSLDEILADDFFTSGFTPKVLSTTCCTTTPKFPIVETLLRSTVGGTTVQRIASSINELKAKDNSDQSVTMTTKVQSRPPRAPDKPSSGDANGAIQSAIQSVVKSHIPSSQSSSRGSNGFIAGSAMLLCSELVTCLELMSPDTSSNPPETQGLERVWITKWVDYTNKYGFGYQLSNRTVGVLFNDTSRISLCPDRRTVVFCDVTGPASVFSTEAVPVELESKSTLLLYFANYMDEHLIKGGDLASFNREYKTSDHDAVYMKKWFRTSRAIVMYLSNGTLQVNFFDDHTKIILGGDSCHGYLVTYINEQRTSCTYRLNDLKRHGCNHVIRERLNYVRHMLYNLIDIEGDSV